MMISRLEMFSQTTPTLILPSEINGSVQLNISAIGHLNTEKFGYEYLSVFVENEGEEYSSNAVQGRYTIEDDYLVFSPYFPFEKGMTYLVRTKKSDVDSNYSYEPFQVGNKEAVDKAQVISIYPSANELPENLLRFYFYFNTPMKKGQALKHIQLVDAEGNIDKHAFMEFKQELWSADGKRLTILFDPGRIKRGVSTNLELGPALLEGNKYQLTISGSWQDVHGQDLSVETTKEFVVVKAYRQHIKVNELEIQEPVANSDDTLSIQFDRIIDHALVHSMIRIEDENEMLVAGHWETSNEEKVVQFIPEKNWKKGMYRIMVDSRLEDIVGNNLNNLLDQKMGEKNSNVQQLIRPFSI
ncbi:MAG: hypothetical protein HRU41_09065 [Saprospiraceae bacterium]|nr:hypothetical protein [Saprospiraceae bacterium]